MIREIETLKEFERIAAHSHIKGLGLDERLKAKLVADGMVGQTKAREAAGIVVKLVKEGKFAGRAILLVGPPGTGKTALAIAIAKELGEDVPFVPLAASEIYSSEMKKTEFLTQALRRAIGVRIREMRKVYEGVVKELKIQEEMNPYNPYMKVPASARIKLETRKESKMLSMDQDFAVQLVKQNIKEGDIIQIDVDGQRIVRLGISEEAAKQKSYDITAEKPLPVPDGKVLKDKEFVYTLSLHQMDIINSKQSFDFFSLMFGSRESKEIDSEIRKQIDNTVKEWIEQGKAEIIPGVVFIDECSLLDIETFAFLNRAMEQELAPIIIFATNRGITTIRGTDIKAPHGMPIDLLDRVLIINTEPYGKEEIEKIIRIKLEADKIEMEEEAIKLLTEIGALTSLRYALQQIATSAKIAETNKRKKIKKEDIEYVINLFSDIKKSVEYVKKYEERMLE